MSESLNDITFLKIQSNRKDLNGEIDVLISTQDYDRVMQHSWHIHNRKYVATVIHYEDGTKDYQYLHRFIMKGNVDNEESTTGRKAKIVAADGNFLNCTRGNLTILRAAEKVVAPEREMSSKYKNISYVKKTDRWKARINHQELKFEKNFRTEELALAGLNEFKRDINRGIVRENLPDVADRLLSIEPWNGSTDSLRSNSDFIASEDALPMSAVESGSNA
jgi:hypothetical protein